MLKFVKPRSGPNADKWMVQGPVSELNAAIESGEPVTITTSKGESRVIVTDIGSRVFDRGGVDYAYANKRGVPEKVETVKEDTDYVPTTEQQAVMNHAATGESLIVQACAGAGKTRTLVETAKRIEGKVVYTAFNRAIVQSGKGKFGENVNATTMHALALNAIDKDMRDRFLRKGDKMRRKPLAQWLKLRHARFGAKDAFVTITAEQQAGMIIKALSEFCQSDDPEPTKGHIATVPTLSNTENTVLAENLLKGLAKVWADLSNTHGEWTYSHAHYLKHFSLSKSVLSVKALMVDEAQDLAPVMLEIVKTQLSAGVQVILVGDSYQAINGFTGAKDAMEALKYDIGTTLYLSRSWRFGEAIANAANMILAPLGCPYVVKGNPAITSTFGASDHEPTMVLCRSNASAMRTVLTKLSEGRKARLMGADKEVTAFCRAAIDLQANRPTDHPDLVWANNWRDVQILASQEDGEDLKLNVDLVDEFGAEVTLAALGDMAEPKDADVIVSTAHKTKGLESTYVKLDAGLGRDSDKLPISRDESMLLYVAVTRGQKGTDATLTDYFRDR